MRWSRSPISKLSRYGITRSQLNDAPVLSHSTRGSGITNGVVAACLRSPAQLGPGREGFCRRRYACDPSFVFPGVTAWALASSGQVKSRKVGRAPLLAESIESGH